MYRFGSSFKQVHILVYIDIYVVPCPKVKTKELKNEELKRALTISLGPHILMSEENARANKTRASSNSL